MTWTDLPELVDDLESWTELEELLSGGAEAVECLRTGLVLEVIFHDWRGGALELWVPGRLRAQDRRRLHRLGLRPTSYGTEPVWTWQTPVPDVPALEPDLGRALGARMAAIEEVQSALMDTVVRVLRDALRLPLSDLAVRLAREEDPLDDESW